MSRDRNEMNNRKNRRRRLPPEFSRKYGVAALNRRRLRVAFILIIFLFAALVFRVGYWQIVRADDLKVMAGKMQNADIEIDPERGSIYDCNMNPLAKSITKYELYAYTQTLYKSDTVTDAERKKILDNLVKYTGEKRSSLKKLLEGKDNLVKLASGLDRNSVHKIEKLYGDNIVVNTTSSRYYPNDDFASQLLGFVDENNSGRIGLEYEYNSVLTGVKGREVKATDSQGNTLASGRSKYYKAQNGESLVTTIDEVIQNYTEEAVAAGMKRSKAESITVIVMEPKSGNVLAMCSSPSFDPNNPYEPSTSAQKSYFKKLSDKKQSEYLSKMWTNSAVSGVYEPGSTFKLITAASALDSGSATLKSKYNCPGYIRVGSTTIHCWDSAHGVQTLKQAVGNSCNPALARVALNMGAKTFYNYIDLFGFDDKTNIDLPGESDSIIKDPDNLGDVDLATTGFGQGIAITPIQLLTAINSLGNGGKLMQPKVVSKVVNSSGKTVKTYKDKMVRRTVSRKVSDEMRDIMQYYVEKGGGTAAYVPGYRIGGKTGTAYIAENGGYSSQTVASFVAMAPMDDPKVSMLVMVTKPKGSEFGATNAGPIVEEIMNNVLPYLGVEKKYSKDEKKETSTATVTVPDVTNKNSKDAIRSIQALGLKYKAVPAGSGSSFLVVDQYPKAGSKIEKNGTVYIYSE